MCWAFFSEILIKYLHMFALPEMETAQRHSGRQARWGWGGSVQSSGDSELGQQAAKASQLVGVP